jgi:hypothetical protein
VNCVDVFFEQTRASIVSDDADKAGDIAGGD